MGDTEARGYTVISGLIRDDQGRIGLKKTEHGYSLPGGFIRGHSVVSGIKQRLLERHNIHAEVDYVNRIYQNFGQGGHWVNNINMVCWLLSNPSKASRIEWFTEDQIFSGTVPLRSSDVIHALQDAKTNKTIPVEYIRRTFDPTHEGWASTKSIDALNEGTVAGAVIQDPEDKYWLMQSHKHPGFWSLLGGGNQAGESLKDTFEREAREEGGVEISLRGLARIFVNKHTRPDGSVFYATSFAAYAQTKLIQPQIPLEHAHEVLCIERFSLDEVRDMLNHKLYEYFRTPDTPLAILAADHLAKTNRLISLDMIVNTNETQEIDLP